MPSPKQLQDQVDRICDKALRDAPKQVRLLRYLTDPKGLAELRTLPSRKILLRFEDSQGERRPGDTEHSLLDRGKRLVSELSRALRLYYSELSPDAPDRVLIQIEAPKAVGDQRYIPRISDYSPARRTAQDESFSFVGTNVEALRYVIERIGKLNRIEETFVRWTGRNSSLYAGNNFMRFLQELKASRLLYRAVLGPMTDAAVIDKGGLCDVLANRFVRDLPQGETAAKLYRLHHSMPLVNFTLLYYFEDESHFYRPTNHVEVLFGYGVHEEYGGPDATVVYRSNLKGLVKEYQKCFDAMRDEGFSRSINLHHPSLFHNQPWQCDVLATFPQLPVLEILGQVKTSGIRNEMQSSEPPPTNVVTTEAQDEYIPGRSHIKICVSALKLLDDDLFLDELRGALQRGVQVSVAFWAEGPFVNARIKAAELRPEAARREMEGARDAMHSLGSHPNLFVRECFGEWASVSIIWIDELIYHSSYWIGRNVSDGPHYLVTASSKSGEVIRDQYKRMITTSRLTGPLEKEK